MDVVASPMATVMGSNATAVDASSMVRMVALGCRNRLGGLGDIPEIDTVATETTRPSVISDSIKACSATAERSDPWRYQAWRVSQ